MATQINDRTELDFRMPKTALDPIMVRCCEMGKAPKHIGRVYQIFNDEGEYVTYHAVNSHGEEIYPPTTDWTTVESCFEHYIKELARKEKEAIYLKQNEREEEIKNIRDTKNEQKEITQQFNRF